MILYVDETENEEYFIVTGLLVESESSVNLAYKQFKNKIKGQKISDKKKRQIYTEFKSTLLDNDFQKIKLAMLEEIVKISNLIVYSCYVKKNSRMNQIVKESAYIMLLSNILTTIKADIDVIFDSFSKPDFEANIMQSVENVDNIKSIEPKDSQIEPGLQFVDNICSVIRLHKSGDEKDIYYEIIKDIVIEV